jgi:ribosomal protein S18 acetylase RimI-like enzyme
MDCDHARRDVLLSMGYTAGDQPNMMVTSRPLDAIPAPALPEGFTIRSAAGEHEETLLGAVHSGAFGSSWPPGEYLKAMQTPGFDIDRELVVVAPDGRFASFLIYWIDPVSRIGLFEPVGCHPDFQRRGLTRALMYEGMRRMAERGMTSAIVLHMSNNPASTRLYASVGFTPIYALVSYTKQKASA